MLLLPLALIVGSYLIGSIPFSFLVVRFFARADIRLQGSGNVGATNVLRTSGKLPGLMALLLDLGKGWIAVMLATIIVVLPQWPFPYLAGSSAVHSHTFWVGLGALLAVLGHMFPVWLGFHGGKGVATATGIFLAIDPMAMGLATIFFLLIVVVTRYVSLGSMTGAAAVPILMRFVTHQPFWIVIFSIIIAIAIIVRHRGNIERLAAGTEHKIGGKKDRS